MKAFWLRTLQRAICRCRRRKLIINSTVALAATALLLMALTEGCGSAKQVRMALVSTPHLNADDSGAPLPVIVRVYQLRSRVKFDQANFKSLWKSDKDVLEGDVVERKELTVHPESEMELNLEVDPKKGSEFLAVVALFRKPNGDMWKKAIPADIPHHNPFTKPRVKLVLDQDSVKLSDKE